MPERASSRRRGGLVGERVEVVHDAGQIEVGVRVEALEEDPPLVVEVALDLEVDLERGLLGPRRAAELQVEALLRDVRDVREHPCHREPDVGREAGAVVVAADEVLVAGDRGAGHRRERDVLGGEACRGAHENPVLDLARVVHRPLQHLHAAEGAADRAVHALDPEVREQAPVDGARDRRP